MIRPGMGALIRGGIFTIEGKSEKEGFWRLYMETQRKNGFISIEIPESEVLEGIEAYRAEQAMRSFAREESVYKAVFRTRFLPRKMDADDPNTH